MEKIEMIQYFQIWTKGEIEQGRWMVLLTIVLVPFIVLLFKSGTGTIGQGMVVPISFLLTVNLCYGTYLILARGNDFQNLEIKIKESPVKVFKTEYKKVQKNNNTYKILRLIWIVLGAVCALLSLFFVKDYDKGISLGFAILFIGLLTVDTFLHSRNIHLLNDLKHCLY